MVTSNAVLFSEPYFEFTDIFSKIEIDNFSTRCNARPSRDKCGEVHSSPPPNKCRCTWLAETNTFLECIFFFFFNRSKENLATFSLITSRTQDRVDAFSPLHTRIPSVSSTAGIRNGDDSDRDAVVACSACINRVFGPYESRVHTGTSHK